MNMQTYANKAVCRSCRHLSGCTYSDVVLMCGSGAWYAECVRVTAKTINWKRANLHSCQGDLETFIKHCGDWRGVIDSVCSRDWRQPMEHWVRARGKRQQPMESAMGQNTKKSTVGCWLLIMACKWLQMIVNVRGSQNANLQILTSNGDGGVYIVCILYCNDAHYAVNFQIHKVVCHLRRPAEPPKTNAAICAQHPRLQAIHKAATGATMHMWCTSSIAAWCWCSHHETWHCTCTGYWSARHFVLRSHCKNLISTRSGELFPQLQL